MLVALTHLVWSAWAFAVFCVLGAILVPGLRPALAYGKLQLTNEGVIPQHMFWPAIYALGLLVNFIFAVLLLIWSGSSLAYLLLTIMFIHLSRRLAETILVHRFSRRFVQPLHAFLGPAYYIGVTMGSQIEELAYPHSVPHWSLVVAGLTLFLWASYQQFAAHATLASMRGRPGRDSLYSIPSGGWFDLVSCPHYAAEILIYTALIVLTGGRNVTLLLVFVFVVLTLSNAALNTHAWYRRKFPDYPRARKALVPGIL